jgi:superfamily II DNA/RNA helicase
VDHFSPVHNALGFLAAIDIAHRQSRHLALVRVESRRAQCNHRKTSLNVTTQPTFADLGVGQPLIDALTARGILNPFPIQEKTLPDTLAGRDVLGRGKTGSGKTLAFSLPLVTRIAALPQRKRPTGLVLAPTRELATQIAAALTPLAAAHGLKVTTIFGGVPQSRQVTALRAGVDVVVACPGRLEDLMKQRIISLDAVEVTVVDEADHMADLGFLPGVTRILAATPQGGQRLLFSATLDNGVDKLVKRFLRNPVTHSVDEAHSPVQEMAHHVFHVADTKAKTELVRHLASGTGRRILFMRTKHQARKLARQLTESGVPSVDLHGNLSQPARDRNLAAFTARAGNAGDVVTVVLPEQRRELQHVMRKAGITVRPQEVSAHSEPVKALVGDIAPYQAPKALQPANAAPHAQGSHRRAPAGARPKRRRSTRRAA